MTGTEKFAAELKKWAPQPSQPITPEETLVTQEELGLLIDQYQYQQRKSLSIHQRGVLNALRELKVMRERQ